VQFDAGLEYRITPIYSDSNFFLAETSVASFVDRDLQNIGLGVDFGIEYFILSDLSLRFANTFRYDFIVSSQTDIDSDFGVKANEYGLLIDYHLVLNYYFRVFGSGDFFLSAGFSRLNTNSDFSSKRSFYDDEGILIGSISTIENFSYWGNRFELGYTNGKGKIGLGIYMSQNTQYFDETTVFIVPFVKFSLKLGEL